MNVGSIFTNLFKSIWNGLFSIQMGYLNLTFGGYLIGMFILSFIATSIYKFMHRSGKE